MRERARRVLREAAALSLSPRRARACERVLVRRAFVKDPDGYLIEVLPQGEMITKELDCLGVALDGGEGYKDNSK